MPCKYFYLLFLLLFCLVILLNVIKVTTLYLFSSFRDEEATFRQSELFQYWRLIFIIVPEGNRDKIKTIKDLTRHAPNSLTTWSLIKIVAVFR